MTIPFTAPKMVLIELDNNSDVGVGSPAQLTNMPTGWYGYEGGADPFNNYDLGTVLLAQRSAPLATTPGGYYVVSEDTVGAKVALLIVDATTLSTVGAKIRYIVAQTGTPQALPGTFATPQAAITQAATDRSGPTIPVDILVMPGSYAGFILEPNMHVAGLADDPTAVQITSQVTYLATATPTVNTQLANMTISTGATIAVDGTNAANYTTGIYNCAVSNSSGGNPTVSMAAGDALNINNSNIANAAGQALTTSIPTTNTSSVFVAASATSAIGFGANVTITMDRCEIRNGTDPSFSGAAGTLVIRGGLPGIASVASGITVTVDRSGGWLPLEQSVNDADVTLNSDTQLALITLVATNRTITLPPTSTQPPLKELIIMRRDNAAGVRCTIQPNAADSIVPGPGLGVSIRLAQGDTLRLMARRGSAEWIRVP